MWTQWIIFSIVFFAASASPTACDTDALAMANFAQNLVSYKAPLPSNWLSLNTTSLCTTWKGVTCGFCASNNSTSCCVTAIRLSGYGFGQTASSQLLNIFTPTLLQLTSLKVLDLSLTLAGGTLPPELSALTGLQELNLGTNNLRGTLPVKWSNLTGLKILNLQNCFFSGQLPTEWGSLTGLQQLSLANNYLDGSLPASWSRLSGLQVLHLEINGFTGVLPSEWSQLSGLKELYLGSNQLQGSLLPEWQSMVALQKLHLESNQLSGTLPVSWKAMRSLVELYLTGNTIGGTLPPEWCSLSSLQIAYFDSNRLTGGLPVAWNQLKSVKKLYLSGNRMTGTLPIEWHNMTTLQILYANVNYFSGTLPAEWSSMSSLVRLYLDGNKFTGSVPVAWNKLSNMQRLSLYNNTLSGTLPAEWSLLTNLQALYLDTNSFTGSLPSAWSSLTQLQRLSFYDNQLSGTLPTEWSSLTSLFRLTGYNNSLSGALPPSWSLMTSLQRLALDSNHLTGFVPAQWSAMKSLVQLTLSNNKLTLQDSLFSNLPQTLVSVDLSGKDNAFISFANAFVLRPTVLKSLSTLHATSKTSIVIKMQDLPMMCPLPDPILISPVIIIASNCRPPPESLLVPGIVVALISLVMALRFLSISKVKETITKVKDSKVFYSFLIVYAFYSTGMKIISFNTILASINIPSAGNCSVMDERSSFELSLPFTFPNAEINSNGTIVTTYFPARSNIDVSVNTDDTRNFRTVPYTTFAEYISLVQPKPPHVPSWPVLLFPLQVSLNIDNFKSICSGFMSGNKIGISQAIPLCSFNSNTNQCERVADPRHDAINIYRPLLLVAIGLYAAKELAQIIVVFMLLCGSNLNNSWRYFARPSPFAFILICRPQELLLLMKSGEAVTSRDLFMGLFYKGLLDEVAQLSLSIYYVLAVSQQGLELGVLLSIANSGAAFVLMIISTIVMWVKEQRQPQVAGVPYHADGGGRVSIQSRRGTKTKEVVIGISLSY